MRVKPVKHLKGEFSLQGDKSVSHRAIIFSSLSDGKCRISNLGMGRDNRSTISIFRQLGVKIARKGADWLVTGAGLRGLVEPSNVLDAGNSGTTIRIMSGILTAQPFFSVMTGDRYLVRRPMRRVIEPLTMMGGKITGRDGNTRAPLAIVGSNSLKGISYPMTVASAQVKSAILMAGLYASGVTTVSEPVQSRDHTERLMRYLGVPVKKKGHAVSVTAIEKLPAFDIDVCGDISSAAFFMVAAALLKGSRLTIRNVGLNRSRTGILDVLAAMGADMIITDPREKCGEPVGDITVRGTGGLRSVNVKGGIIPRLIDEIPVIAVAAAFADGTSVIDDAEELRVKESDRIQAMVSELKRLNVAIEETPKGMIVRGRCKPGFARVKSYGDHRIAMALYVFGLCSGKGLEIDETASIGISFPDFFSLMGKVADA